MEKIVAELKASFGEENVIFDDDDNTCQVTLDIERHSTIDHLDIDEVHLVKFVSLLGKVLTIEIDFEVEV